MNRPKIIAEIKRGSPYDGLINRDCNVEQYVRDFERLGVSAISVATGSAYFGNKEMLKVARATTKLPIMRRDNFTTEEQVAETKALGADWILFNSETLAAELLDRLVFYAGSIGLRPVVEIFSGVGVLRFMAAQGNTVMITSRDPRTNKLDFHNTMEQLKVIPDKLELFVDGGLYANPNFVDVIKKFPDIDWLLVGTLFMKSQDLETTFKTLWENLYSPRPHLCGCVLVK